MRRLLCIILGFGAALAGRADYDTEARQHKADYFFMEGLRQRALGQEDLSTALMQRALDNSGDPTGREAFEVGSRMMMFGQINRDSLQLARGVELCERYFGAHPEDVYAGSYMASYHADRGNAGRAIEIYETLERSKPDNAALMGAHADLLMRQRRVDEATALYRRLERSMGRSTTLTHRLVSGLVMQGDTAAAIAEIDNLIAAQPRSVEALHLGAYMSTMLNRPELGLTYVDRARELDPANGETYYHAANIYKALGRTDDYDAAIRGAIDGDDVDLPAKVELLRYYIGEELAPGDLGGAVKIDPLFESLTGQYPHDADLRRLYATYLITLGRYGAAAEQMQHAVNLDASRADDFVLLARLYVTSGEPDNAISTAGVGLQLYPSELTLYEVKAGAQSHLKMPDAAIATLSDAMKIDKLTPQGRSALQSNIADIMQQDDRTPADSIAARYERALELDPENDLAMNNYAYWLSENGGDLLRAKELIARAVVYEPASATYYDTYAWVCYRLGDLENAKRYIDMAILFDKSEQEGAPEQMGEVLRHAAHIYESLGQHDKAGEYRARAEQLTSTEEE